MRFQAKTTFCVAPPSTRIWLFLFLSYKSSLATIWIMPKNHQQASVSLRIALRTASTAQTGASGIAFPCWSRIHGTNRSRGTCGTNKRNDPLSCRDVSGSSSSSPIRSASARSRWRPSGSGHPDPDIRRPVQKLLDDYLTIGTISPSETMQNDGKKSETGNKESLNLNRW